MGLYVSYVLEKKKRNKKRMKFHIDQWVIYNPFADNPLINQTPKSNYFVHVYTKNERSMYNYKIYIDVVPGIYKDVREKDLHLIEE